MTKPIDVRMLPLLLLAGLLGCHSQPRTDASSEARPRQTRQREGRPAEAQAPQGPGRRAGSSGERVTLSPEEKETIEVQTVPVTRRPIDSRLSVMGKVLVPQNRKAIVSYAFPARVAEVHVAVGDWVKRGQTLLMLESEEVGTAKLEFYRARADLELAKASFERESHLFERGVGAQKSLLTAEAERKVAEATLETAEKKLHVLGFTEDQVREIQRSHQVHPSISLQAPISSRVIESQAVLGAMVDQSTEILTLMDPTTLWVDAEIYERDISRVHPGQKVTISVPAYPDQTFGGTLSYVGDVLKEDTRTITVRTEVDNPHHRLKPGMFADVQISMNGASPALVVPKEAVLDDGDERIVFVLAGDGFEVRAVQVGARRNGDLEITAGLREGESVATLGAFQLKSKLYRELTRARVH
jgi:cobalt-zinc-cadmium efflux system membrane fusion protein